MVSGDYWLLLKVNICTGMHLALAVPVYAFVGGHQVVSDSV